MPSSTVSGYTPLWRRGVRVQFVRAGHPQNSQLGRILDPLPNPSGRPEHQWYDVIFDSGVYGRFLQRALVSADDSGGWPPRPEPV